MKITAASEADFDTVKNITQQTIKAVYPHYYPKGAVEYNARYPKRRCFSAIYR